MFSRQIRSSRTGRLASASGQIETVDGGRIRLEVGKWVHGIISPNSKFFQQAILLYTSTFPRTERADENDIRDRLVHRRSIMPNKFRVEVIGVGKKSPSNTRGVAIYHYMYRSNSGCLAFLAIRSDARRQGLGSALFQHVRNRILNDSRNVRSCSPGIFCELSIVASREKDSMLSFWRSNNMFPFPFKWLHPRITRGDSPESLALAFSPLVKEYSKSIPASLVERAAEDIYSLSYNRPSDDILLARARRIIEKTASLSGDGKIHFTRNCIH